MADQQHLEILKQGVEAWNQWRQAHRGVVPDLNSADLKNVDLKKSNLYQAHLKGADLSGAHLEDAVLYGAHLEDATLIHTNLKGADLSLAHLERAHLGNAHLERADLSGAHLESANLYEANLEGANLENAFFDSETGLDEVTLTDQQHGSISVADVRWGGVNLAVVDWTPLKKLGDEQDARRVKWMSGSEKTKEDQLLEYREAVRANRQLAVVLREQGLNEEADHFAYRAQCLQRIVSRRQRRWLKFIFSWFLYLLAGYGYRPLRSIAAYVLLILGFAVAFYALGHLLWYEALVVSLTAFHGRGFFSQQYQPGDPQSIIAAVEAVVGLLIEISFIATFTQRFFGR